jgi:hypothetical protein
MPEAQNPPEESEPSPEARSRMLIEYQAAQQSAQHHDTTAWSFISITWGASLVLMGFVLNSVREANLRILLSVFSAIGILFVITVWVARNQMNAVKRQKYARCKELEAKLGFRQHSQLAYQEGRGGAIVTCITLALVFAWLALLFTIWCTCGK